VPNFSKYIGLRFKNLGRDFFGVDCYGLLWLIYKEERNIKLPDYTDLQYCRREYCTEKLEGHILNNLDIWQKIKGPPKIYDGLLFRTNKVFVSHIGLYIGNNRFIHAQRKHHSMTSKLEGPWKERLYSIMRYKGEIYG